MKLAEKLSRVMSEKGISAADIERHGISRDEVIFFLEKLRGDPSDPEYREKLVRIFLQAVYVYKNGRIVIACNYAGENGQPLTFESVSSSLEHMAGQMILNTNHGAVLFSSWFPVSR